MRRSLLLMMLVMGITACVKKPLPIDKTMIETGSIGFSFEHVAGTNPLVLNSKWYMTENNDSVKFTTFNYYISNIVFIDENGNEYKQPESYYLIREDNPSSKSFTVRGIPIGKYVKLRMMIGVDSARNTSGAQTGALDPSNGMFWDWNTGYIMSMIEGVSPQSKMFDNLLMFHLGGFKHPNNVIKTITLDFPDTVLVTATDEMNIHIKTDILEWFKTPNKINISELTGNMLSGGIPNVLADNYVDMFSVDHVE